MCELRNRDTSDESLRQARGHSVRALAVAGLALAGGIIAATAQEMKSPRIVPVHVDWEGVLAELKSIDALQPLVQLAGQAPRLQESPAPDPVVELNRAAGERFANIAASPIPVLLPFDTAA